MFHFFLNHLKINKQRGSPNNFQIWVFIGSMKAHQTQQWASSSKFNQTKKRGNYRHLKGTNFGGKSPQPIQSRKQRKLRASSPSSFFFKKKLAPQSKEPNRTDKLNSCHTKRGRRVMGLYQMLNKKKRGGCIGWTQEANEGGALRSDLAFVWQLENFESQENDLR